MCERMLDKQTQPTFESMAAYCGGGGESFSALNAWLTGEWGTMATIVFPYGNQYGWGVAHRNGKKLICNVFPENGAFTVMMRLNNSQFDSVYSTVGEDTQRLIDNKFPCADGGWIHFRVLNEGHLADVRRLLSVKCGAVGTRDGGMRDEGR